MDSGRSSIVAVAGDVHGQFATLAALLERFERAVGSRVDLLLQVGDLEPEKADAPLDVPLVWIGGNHDALAADPGGIGRAGVVERLGLRIAGLSDRARKVDVAALLAAGTADVLLLHEWPEGLTPEKGLCSNGRLAVERLSPAWVFCGHRHRAFARDWTLGESLVRVRCLANVPAPRDRNRKSRGDATDCVLFFRVSDVSVPAAPGEAPTRRPRLEELAPLEELEALASAGKRRRR